MSETPPHPGPPAGASPAVSPPTANPPAAEPEAAATGSGRGAGRWRPALRTFPLGLALGSVVGLVVKDLDLAALVSFDGSREGLAALIAFGVAALWTFGLHRLVGTTVAGALALWALVAFTPVCPWLANGLVRNELVEPADAVFVSFAALSSGELAHAEERSRLLRALELVARRKAPLVVVPEGDAARLTATREVMQILEVGPDKLISLPAARNTHEEAVALARVFRERQWRLVIVVTSPLHSSRAGACLAREHVAALLAPALETRFDVEDLSRAADRINAFGSVMHEQVGRLVYNLRGWS